MVAEAAYFRDEKRGFREGDVQQDWLDRSSLLEDLRVTNLPHSLSRHSLTGYHLPRWIRIARQVPGALSRRLWHTVD